MGMTSEPEVLTWWVEIDHLDDETVSFSWPSPAYLGGFFKITLNRQKWIDMGRPSKLKVVVFDDRDGN